MADSNLLSKAEQALVAVIVAGLGSSGSGNVFTGKASGDKSAPCVICACDAAIEEDPPYSGNYWVDAAVIVKYIAGREADEVDPKANADVTLATVVDIVNDSALAGSLSSAAVTGFTCFGTVPNGMESNQEEDHWQDTFRLRLYCCPSDIS